MSYISGARSLPDEQVRIASTKMDGIGPKKAIQLRYRLGISGNIKMNELTKYQIDQIEQMIAQDHVVHWELKVGPTYLLFVWINHPTFLLSFHKSVGRMRIVMVELMYG